MTKNPKYKIEDLIKEYELQNRKITDSVYNSIVQLLNAEYQSLAYISARARLINNRFLPKYIIQKIDTIVESLSNRLGLEIKRGIVKSWVLSENKMAHLETDVFGGGEKPPSTKVNVSGDMKSNFSRIRKEFGTGSESALREFVKKDLNLSSRVWKRSAKQFIKDTLADGIKQGRSARELAKDLKEATLSKNGKMKSSGPGVYKDPKANAYRTARNSINDAYRSNDLRHYQSAWWIIGIRVSLSLAHPKYDMCDNLAGDYPKDFIFKKWHINCLCFSVPILASQALRDAMLRYQLGKLKEPPEIKNISKIPKAAVNWVKKNRKRMEGWKTVPEWLTGNEKYF